MLPDHMTTIQIDITIQTRKRLELVKALISQTRNGAVNPTWADAVTLLADMVPIGQLLLSTIDTETTTIKTGEPNERTEPNERPGERQEPAGEGAGPTPAKRGRGRPRKQPASGVDGSSK